MNPDLIPVTGKCDVCDKPGVYWYASTNARYCGSEDCETKLDERYQEHCEEFDRKEKLKSSKQLC